MPLLQARFPAKGSQSLPAFREEGSSWPAGAGAAFESGRKDGRPRGVRARPAGTLASGAAEFSLRSAARAFSPGRSRPLAAGSALRAEAMGKGGGRAIMKGKMVGGRARAPPPYSPGRASAGSPSTSPHPRAWGITAKGLGPRGRPARLCHAQVPSRDGDGGQGRDVGKLPGAFWGGEQGGGGAGE